HLPSSTLQLSTYHTFLFIFFFHSTATTDIYTLSLHDALPIYQGDRRRHLLDSVDDLRLPVRDLHGLRGVHDHPHAGDHEHLVVRSEEHTSELQSRFDLVCRLLLEKKKKITIYYDMLHII